jgi:hypothetical protein
MVRRKRGTEFVSESLILRVDELIQKRFNVRDVESFGRRDSTKPVEMLVSVGRIERGSRRLEGQTMFGLDFVVQNELSDRLDESLKPIIEVQAECLHLDHLVLDPSEVLEDLPLDRDDFEVDIACQSEVFDEWVGMRADPIEEIQREMRILESAREGLEEVDEDRGEEWTVTDRSIAKDPFWIFFEV